MTPEQRREILVGPVMVWLALLVLLAITAAYAYAPDMPAKSAASLAIGAAKAILVALFFMQLRRAAGLVRLASLAGLAWLSLLFLFAFADYLTR